MNAFYIMMTCLCRSVEDQVPQRANDIIASLQEVLKSIVKNGKDNVSLYVNLTIGLLSLSYFFSIEY